MPIARAQADCAPSASTLGLVGWQPDDDLLRIPEVFDENLSNVGRCQLASRDPVGVPEVPRASREADDTACHVFPCEQARALNGLSVRVDS